MVRAIARQAEAEERERRAKIIHAEGEQQARTRARGFQTLSGGRRRCSCAYLQTITNIAETSLHNASSDDDRPDARFAARGRRSGSSSTARAAGLVAAARADENGG